MANITDNSSMEAPYSFHDGQKIGVIITALVALISFISVFLLFVYNRPQRNTFKNPQTYTYFLCLLVSVLLQELGAVLSFGWGAMGSIGVGTLCNAQGSFKQVGELATAVWSTVLALHTFHILFLRVRATKKVFISALISGWTIVLVLSVIGLLVLQRKGSYFSVVGGSCGVASSYLLARLLTGYLFAFVAIFIGVSLSLLVLLRIRGNLSRDRYNRWQLYVVPSNDKDWKIAFSREATSTSTAMQQVTTKLVLYPVRFLQIVSRLRH
ncbi:hypothetical protein CPC08DRAFT_90335 [Agrocybe pediades]|nr:hypothetical protein CPC08DRAFT_90335 [Agrocybe pediades]